MSRESVIEVVGGRNVGGKAGMLIDHEDIIREAGLELPPTIVIASEALEPIKRQMDPTDQRHMTRPEGIGHMVVDICTTYADSSILAVRSSAEGDGRGNGIYDSVFTGNTRRFVGHGLDRVLRSFHTQGARDFREQANLGDSFAVMVQPLVGQLLEDNRKLFGPPLSGYGYSQTRADLYGMINVVAGLGGGVERLGGEQINHFALSDARSLASMWLYPEPTGKLSFFDYIATIREGQKTLDVARHDNDFRNQDSLEKGEETLSRVAGLALRPEMDETGLYTPDLVYLDLRDGIHSKLYMAARSLYSVEDDNMMLKAMKAFKPEQLLNALGRMEEIAGYPLYVEWALGMEADKVCPLILQIAPFEQSERASIEAELPEDLLIVGKSIKGHGICTATKIIYMSHINDLRMLREFNQDPANKGYILVYPARLTTDEYRERLNFADFSNSAAIIETSSRNVHGSGTMLDHIGGGDGYDGEIFR